MNQADTAWMLVATALVLLMTPALAFFYGGLVRSKNSLNTMMMSFISLGFVGILWALFGYSLAFTPGNALIGDLSNMFLSGVGLEAKGTIPHSLFMCYQGTFCIITAALISGSIVERMRFSAYVAFISLWALVVYSPIAHWVWGGGWLAQWGALDFAGGTVVHVNAAVAAVVAAVVVGKRSEYPSSSLLPHNVPFVLLGAGLLCVHDHNARPGGDARGVDLPGRDEVRQADGGWRRDGHCCRPGGDYAGGRFHQPDERDPPGRVCRSAELLHAAVARENLAR